MGTKMRLAKESDLPAILKVEESWPVAGRAGADKFLARLRNFGRGFFVATLGLPEGGERIIGTITSMPVSYEPTRPHAFKSWDAVTHDGYLGDCRLEGCDALYIVSGVIDAEHRSLNVAMYWPAPSCPGTVAFARSKARLRLSTTAGDDAANGLSIRCWHSTRVSASRCLTRITSCATIIRMTPAAIMRRSCVATSRRVL